MQQSALRRSGVEGPRPDAGVTPVARIGPNAITRVAESIGASEWSDELVEIFDGADLRHYLLEPPETMVDEEHVIALHRTARSHLGRSPYKTVMRDAGRRTADYLLANRIPRPIQPILRFLPPSLAARALLSAIGGHAWTFAGSGEFTWSVRRGALLTIRECPLARAQPTSQPNCHYYAATFERLFQELVHPATKVQEISCEAAGGDACRFRVRWV